MSDRAGMPRSYDEDRAREPGERYLVSMPEDALSDAADIAEDLRDRAEEAYWGKFCPACGDSPCGWDGEPDGFQGGKKK